MIGIYNGFGGIVYFFMYLYPHWQEDIPSIFLRHTPSVSNDSFLKRNKTPAVGISVSSTENKTRGRYLCHDDLN